MANEAARRFQAHADAMRVLAIACSSSKRGSTGHPGGTATSSLAAPAEQGAAVVTPVGIVQTPTLRQGLRLAGALERQAAYQQAQVAALATPTGGWVPLAAPLGPA